ncbi:hypothetical protein GF318_01230 [Candidatus Micrarchaeota archaeon]|nr:hypothetical protein [Candidatus Micrarchaeota archaeon]
MIEFTDDYLVVKGRLLVLKLRSLGAGVEEGEETKITYLEAAYFADRGVLPADRDKLLERSGEKNKKEKYMVIKYLRDRGFIVRPSLDGTGFLRLHRKGFRPGEDKTYYLIHVVPGEWSCSLQALLPLLETAGKLRKELAIAVVDLSRDKPMFIKFSRMAFE